MRIARIAVVLLVGLALPAAIGVVGAGARNDTNSSVVIARVIDGDTVALSNGKKVRLVQIDTPELGGGECYSQAARRALLRLTPVGSAVLLEADPALDRVDRYGRLLRYVKRDGVNVNIRLVLVGAAAPYFYGGDHGKYASRIVAAASRARAGRKGLWGACPGTSLNMNEAVQTRRSTPQPVPPKPTPQPGGNCDPNYAEGCVPRVRYDLDCADIRALGIAPVRVIGTDVHRLDGDDDGWGCE
jgi:endonuclease YncB( thermonuclease family)